MTSKNTSKNTFVIAVGNQKGGVSKTTTTVHLAAALGEKGRRCLIWDLDMNHGATLHLGIPPDTYLGT
jgi:chromosome partitioning protein